MDYFKQRRAYRQWKQNEGSIARGQNDVYRELLDYANDEGHLDEPFKLRNSALCDWTGLSLQGVIKARNDLVNLGLIEYKPGKKNKSTPTYQIKKLYYTNPPGKSNNNQGYYTKRAEKYNQSVTTGSSKVEQPVEQSTLLVPDHDLTSNNNTSRAETDFEQDFEKLWNAYPRRNGKAKAKAAYSQAILAQETTADAIMAKIDEYKAQIKAKNTGPAYIKTGGNWFDEKGWLDDYDATPEPVATSRGQRTEPEPDWVKPGYERPKEAVSAEAQQQLDEQLAQLRAQREQRQKESEQA